MSRADLINRLEKEFTECWSISKDLGINNEYISSIRNRDDNAIFPPYIPFVGEFYSETEHENPKIFIYGTAQAFKKDGDFHDTYENNFDKLMRRLYYGQQGKDLYDITAQSAFDQICIEPYASGILPALAGLYLYINRNERSKTYDDLNQIHRRIAVSNYYKFSLRTAKNKDWNPERNMEGLTKYYEINDNLVRKELNILKPDIVIVGFAGHRDKSEVFSKVKDIKVIQVNDPAWIRRRPKCLTGNGSWSSVSIDDGIDKIIEEHTKKIINQESGLPSYRNIEGDYIKRYLRYYADEWYKKMNNK